MGVALSPLRTPLGSQIDNLIFLFLLSEAAMRWPSLSSHWRDAAWKQSSELSIQASLTDQLLQSWGFRSHKLLHTCGFVPNETYAYQFNYFFRYIRTFRIGICLSPACLQAARARAHTHTHTHTHTQLGLRLQYFLHWIVWNRSSLILPWDWLRWLRVIFGLPMCMHIGHLDNRMCHILQLGMGMYVKQTHYSLRPSI